MLRRLDFRRTLLHEPKVSDRPPVEAGSGRRRRRKVEVMAGPRHLRRVLAAPDKFKGTATAAEVAAAIGHACWEREIDCTEIPMADGGDGLLEVLGGANRTSTVTGPLGGPGAR